MHGATSQRRQETRLYQAAKRSIEPAADCRHGNSNAMNSPRSDSPVDVTREMEKLFAFDLALERVALRRQGAAERWVRKECFKKLEKRDRNNVAVVQRAIKVLFHSRHPMYLERRIRVTTIFFIGECKL